MGAIMGNIDYKKIYEKNRHDWYAMTEEPQKYEALLAGHYSDSNHFVYELLQNAEDEDADRVVIEYYTDHLVFYHNGNPFDEDDVKGVSSMLMGTKNKNDAQTIGKFGMGFKSVFKYTYQPEIYSDDESFLIKNYLLPEEVETNWDYTKTRLTLEYPDNNRGTYRPFANTPHLTKFIIPFKKKASNGKIFDISGKDVLDKLRGLNGEILIFLSSINEIYWINKTKNEYAHITKSISKYDNKEVVCSISSSHKKEEKIKYLKYSGKKDFPEMKGAEYSIAYLMAPNARSIIATKSSPIWVYFPTREITELPFLLHGSFETAVSREKLMTVSSFNTQLFDEIGNLIAESMDDLARRGLLSQNFIREILIQGFIDENTNHTIPGLKEKITRRFKKNALIPCKHGIYKMPESARIPIPFAISELEDNPLLASHFKGGPDFVTLNQEHARNFTEYISWMIKDLGVKPFGLNDLAHKLNDISVDSSMSSEKLLDSIKSIFSFLSGYRESLYEKARYYTFNRAGYYESIIANGINDAWIKLRHAPIILNEDGSLVPAYLGNEPNVYLNASSSYETVASSSIVNRHISKEFEVVLKDSFQIPTFDNLQYVKEKVIKKYMSGDDICHQDDSYMNEYLQDIHQLLEVVKSKNNLAELDNLISKASIVKVETGDATHRLVKPGQAFFHQSDEGINLKTYILTPQKTEGKEDNTGPFPIDETFYRTQGISKKELSLLGMITSVVDYGLREYPGAPGVESWKALGDYCPKLRIRYFEENLRFIEGHPHNVLAKEKSSEVLHLLLDISHRLKGTVRRRKTNPYFTEDENRQFSNAKRIYSWLFNKDGKLCKISNISKYDLDTDIYGELLPDKTAYELLGFLTTKDDTAADAFDQVDKLDERNKRLLMRQLAREFGMKMVDASSHSDEAFNSEDVNNEASFTEEDYYSAAFPVSRIRNMERLIEHVRQQFFCADPVKYTKVLRQIRTSKSLRAVRAYSKEMYTNDGDITVCQICRQPSSLVDITEIANFGIELPQLHLCLCKNCSAKYKSIRDVNKGAFKERIQKGLMSITLEADKEEFETNVNDQMSLFFTQTHIAEIQTILGLLAEYGIPNAENNLEEITNTTISIESEDLQKITPDPAQQSTTETSLKQKDNSSDINEEKQSERTDQHDGASVVTKVVEDPILPEEQHDRVKHEDHVRFDFDNIPDSEPIKDGNLVSYKKMNTLEIVDAVIDSSRYPLHKNFIGKQVGDLIVANGRRYLIISIL